MKKIEKNEMKALKGGLSTGIIVCLSNARCYRDLDTCASRCASPSDCVMILQCRKPV
jgi:hypothetical protein